MKKYVVQLEQQIVKNTERVISMIECLVQAENADEASSQALNLYPFVEGLVYHFISDVKEVDPHYTVALEGYLTLLNPSEV